MPTDLYRAPRIGWLSYIFTATQITLRLHDSIIQIYYCDCFFRKKTVVCVKFCIFNVDELEGHRTSTAGYGMLLNIAINTPSHIQGRSQELDLGGYK